MELSFKFQEKTYPIVITRKKRKRIAVKIDPSGWIRVSCPEHCSHRTAVKFLEKNRAWLEKALIIHEGMERKLGISACLKYRRTYLFGKPHLLREKPDLKPPYEIREGVIYYRGNPADALEALRRDNHAYIEEEFERARHAFSEVIKQKPFLTIRKMKSRWGSCNHRTGRITINRALVHLSPRLLRFVMVHEFVHLVHPNHGRDFKELLGRLYPTHREAERELKNYVFLLKID